MEKSEINIVTLWPSVTETYDRHIDKALQRHNVRGEAFLFHSPTPVIHKRSSYFLTGGTLNSVLRDINEFNAKKKKKGGWKTPFHKKILKIHSTWNILCKGKARLLTSSGTVVPKMWSTKPRGGDARPFQSFRIETMFVIVLGCCCFPSLRRQSHWWRKGQHEARRGTQPYWLSLPHMHKVKQCIKIQVSL